MIYKVNEIILNFEICMEWWSGISLRKSVNG